jgi:hypothetical protein
MKQSITLCVIIYLFLFACSGEIPGNAVLQDRQVVLYPDYTNTVIPWNIAPMNFNIREEADGYLTVLYSSKGQKHLVSGKKVQFPMKHWKKLLEENKGDTLCLDVYLKKDRQWLKFPVIKNRIAPEAIDPYIAYRLIEPSYVTYEKLSIRQRELNGFEEKVIFSNQPLAGKGDRQGQCINCHSFRNYNRTGDMQFHVREQFGGTVIVSGDSVKKVNLKTEHTLSAGVYPSWHPVKNLIAYSTNITGQNFHTLDRQKVEVMDAESDLILYDIDKNEVSIIAGDTAQLETFPAWSNDGKYLYYASASCPDGIGRADKQLYSQRYMDFHYNICRKTFNPETQEFAATDTVFDASAYGKSATFPRESPDGRYLLFTMGDYGNFHIWHKSSDLYLLDMETRTLTDLKEVNSPEVESYHSWSSNGRWIIFSSRRDDGSYTRLYIAYFKDGEAFKPFVLPQRNPDFYGELFLSYNIPEFMTEAVTVPATALAKAIKKEAKPALFNGKQKTRQTKPDSSDNENFYE